MIAVSCFTKNTLIVYIPILFLFDTFDLKVFSYFDHLPNASFLYFICVFRGSFNVRLLKLRIVQDRFYLICPHSFIRFLLLNHIYVQIDTYFLNFTQCQMLPFCSLLVCVGVFKFNCATIYHTKFSFKGTGHIGWYRNKIYMYRGRHNNAKLF